MSLLAAEAVLLVLLLPLGVGASAGALAVFASREGFLGVVLAELGVDADVEEVGFCGAEVAGRFLTFCAGVGC